MSSSSEQYPRHRMDGSMPWTRTTCRAEPGAVATAAEVVGQVISRRPSSPRLVIGRLTWKSWYSSESSSSTCSAFQTSCRCTRAWVAAAPASFQPSNAASMTGPRSGPEPVCASVMGPA